MRFAITHNNYNPAGGGGRCPASSQGAKCKNRPNKANKPPKITNHYENKNK